MRSGVALLLAVVASTSLSARAAAPSRPSAGAEGLLAADAAVHAPPDLKRQLVRHRARLMQGVADAVAAEDRRRDAAAHGAAAVRAAHAVAEAIRGHAGFAKAAYEAGGLVHECAAAEGIGAAAPKRSRFLGYSKEPFGDPASLAALRAADAAAWDRALTRATRLLAWAWKRAGGDASIAHRMPEAKGPYTVRE